VGHPNTLRRAVRLADGFIGGGSTTTESFLEQARFVHEVVARAGRDPATFRVAKRVYLAVEDDRRWRASG
jgi:alkanesulfonate monooxygenase SsuD/methylene tetrahydromethanopterin reductase-like flavin-dependent oxidoreductase (luciferase family)